MNTYLILLSLLALGLLGTLALFVSLKQEVERRAQKDRERFDALTAKLAESFPVRPSEFTPALRSGLNFTKRIQVMQLLRQGESVAQVATALSLSPREVDLMVRVQKIVASNLSKATAAE